MKFRQLHFFNCFILSCVMLLLASGNALAQVQVCTNHAQTGNANNTVLFNVENTTTSSIMITDISAMASLGAAGTYTFTLLYNPDAVNSSGATWTQGTVGVGQNGWVQAGTATVTLPAHTTPQTVITGMTLTVPAGDTFGLALTCNSALYYSALTTSGVNVFSGGGVNILTGDNISWGAAVLPSTPGNYPRGFIGCINWISTTPCSGTPNAGTTVSSTPSVCPSGSANLSLTGATVGLGLTYQWQSSVSGSGVWTDIIGATNATYTATQTASTDYHAIVTCSGQSDTSADVTVGVSSFLSCYCSSTVANTGDEEILNVTFGTLNNTSTFGQLAPGPGSTANRYSNYTTSVAAPTIGQGLATPFSVQIGQEFNGNYTNYYRIYIDLNRDGDLTDLGENVYTSPALTGATTTSGLLFIPSTADTGITLMRVISTESSAASSPCGSNSTWGEVEDYYIHVITPPGCSGQPTAGTATSNKTSVCANSAFTLTLSGYTNTSSNINIQWESSPAGAGSWTAITNATAPTYTVTAGITSATDYRAVVTCTNGGQFDNSTVVSVGMNPFYVCYCGPATGVTLSSFGFNVLTNVTIPTTSINNTTTTAPSNSYNLFYPTTAATSDTLTQGVQYVINTTHGGTGYYSSLWIDYDQNGVFDTSEYVSITTTGSAGTGTFTVPYTALPGTTGMRVRTYWQTLGNAMACTPNNSYETEDYVIEIAAAVPCSGQPVAGIAGGPSTMCANAPFSLTLTGNTVGLGISVQWESSPAGAGVWTPVAGATSPIVSVSGGLTAATDYRAVVTCANGGQFDNSNVITVNVSPFYLCYCGPATGITLNSFATNYITNVSIASTTLNNTTTTTSSTGYTLFYPLTGTNSGQIMQGTPYTLTTTSQYSGYYAGVWIDYDQNGTFDASEYTAVTYSGTNGTASFTVPLTATPGFTGMRVRLYWTGYSATQACATFNDYETEDYVVEILQAPLCTGTPSAGTAYAAAGVCSGASFNLTDTAYTVGMGISVQWEESPAGQNTWTAIAGATTPTYTVSGGITTATDYRMTINCSASSSSAISNVISIAINPFYACYCASGATSTFDGELFNVTVGSLNNTTACPGLSPSYANYTSLPAPSLGQGTNIPVSFVAGSCNGSYGGYLKVYVDFNQNGSFSDPGEEAFVSSSFTYSPAGTPVSGTLAVPLSATLGTTGMRVVMMETGSAGSVTPCGTYGYGETEDYSVVITAPPACLQPTGLGAANITSTSADVSWTAVSGASGYEYAVDQTNTPAPSATAVPTSSTTPATITGLNAASTYYLHVRTDCGGSGYSAWSVYSFNTIIPNDVCSGAITIPGTGTITGNNTMATDDILPAVSCGNTTSSYKGLWYTVSTLASGNLTLSLCSSSPSWDSYLRVYEGSCGNFTICKGSDDDGCGSALSTTTISAVANTTYYVLVTGYGSSSMGAFTLTATGVPLAIKMENFSAVNTGAKNRLDWNSASESKGDRYEVERSADGRNFGYLGTVNAKGEASHYSYFDEKPVSGVNYYRLKLVSASGEASYSEVRTATVKNGSFSVEAYPNPVSDQLTVKAYGASGNGTVTVADATGKVVKVISTDNGSAVIDMKSLAQGMYLVKYADNTHSQVIKVNKQ